MFEAVKQRQSTRRGLAVPAVVALVVGGVVIRWCALEQREREVARMQSAMSFGLPVPGTTPSPVSIRRELPGMSLDSATQAAFTGDYWTGSVEHSEGVVKWYSGELSEESARAEVVKVISTLDKREPGWELVKSGKVRVADLAGWQFQLANKRRAALPVVITTTDCGNRIVQFFAGTSGSEWLASFRCTPDPAQHLERESVVLEARTEWRRLSPSLPVWFTNAHDVLVGPSFLPNPFAETVEQVVWAAAEGGRYQFDRSVSERGGRKVWRGTWLGAPDSNGQSRQAVLVAWACPDHRVATVYVTSPDAPGLEDGLALALTGRCLGPGEVRTDPVNGPR